MSFTVRRIRETPKQRPTRQWKMVLLTVLQLGGPALRLYSLWKQRREKQHKRENRIHMLKRIFLILLAVFCALLLLAGTVRALVAMRVLSVGSIAGVTGAAPPADANGFTNILLLGQGDKDHDGVDLTDTLMVASLDPEDTKSAVLLSLPRDLYVLKTENMGRGRMNSLYRDYKALLKAREGLSDKEASIQAMQELQAEISRLLDIELHHTVKVDFIGFVEAVDALGGIDVVVPEDLIDTQYPDNNYGYETFILRAGPQHLDGETALKYARSRHSSSDFARSARQQQIISAMADKAKDSGFVRDPKAIANLFRILSENVMSTMSLREMIGLAEMGQRLDRSRIVTMQLNSSNGLYSASSEAGGLLYPPPREEFGGASVLLPVSIPPFPVTWKQIRTLVDLLTEQRAVYLANPPISVLNAGASSGDAGRLGGELIRFGFNVEEIANASVGDLAASQVSYLQVEDEPLGKFFGELLSMPTQPLPVDLAPEESRRITIILGEDYTYTPLQDVVPAPTDDPA